MAGPVPATHVLLSAEERRGCPGHLARRRASRFCPGMTIRWRTGRGRSYISPRNPRYTRAMSGAGLHVVFDVAAWCTAAIAMWWLSRQHGLQFSKQSFELPYIAALVFGAGIGAYIFGTLNL